MIETGAIDTGALFSRLGGRVGAGVGAGMAATRTMILHSSKRKVGVLMIGFVLSRRKVL